MKKRSGWKKTLSFLIKPAVAGGIIAFLASRGNSGDLLRSLRGINPLIILAAALVYGSHLITTAWRWKLLTEPMKIKMSLKEAFSLSMQGYFFSLVLPGGAIGGDVIKMGFLAGRTPAGSKAEGVFTVVMDRIVGMLALFGMALILTLCSAGNLMTRLAVPGVDNPAALRTPAVLAICGICLAGIGVSCVLFMHKTLERLPGFGALLKKTDKISGDMVTRLTSAADVYAREWKLLVKTTFIGAALIHTVLIFSPYILLTGCGVKADLFTVAVALTVGNLAGCIPMSPGGIGLRDLAIVAILGAGGIKQEDATAVQLIYTAIIVFFNLAGGLFFLFDPGRKKTTANGNDIKP